MDFTPPRGTQDLLPPRSESLGALGRAAARIAGLYGYRFVETPAFEATELFSRTAGESSEVVTKEMYTFQDKGGRSLTLRPEGTAPVVRALLAASHELPSPFKGFYVEPMWRYGRPQAGRLREFRSFGIEVVGAAEPGADVEVIAVGDRYLREVGLGSFVLEINSIGDEVCRPAYRKELVAYLEANRERLRDEHRDRFVQNPLRVLDCKNEACMAVAAGAPKISDRLCEPCAGHFAAVLAGLEREGVVFVHRPTLVRGLDYYTRTTFEFGSPVLSSQQGTLCGGGRYDGLAELLGGPPTPGVGFGLGLDRVLLALEKEGREVRGRARLDCWVVAVGEVAERRASEVLRELRRAGVSADASYERRALGAQMRAADRSGARFALIVGERETGAGTVTWRRLADGAQFEGSISEAVGAVMAEREQPA